MEFSRPTMFHGFFPVETKIISCLNAVPPSFVFKVASVNKTSTTTLWRPRLCSSKNGMFWRLHLFQQIPGKAEEKLSIRCHPLCSKTHGTMTSCRAGRLEVWKSVVWTIEFFIRRHIHHLSCARKVDSGRPGRFEFPGKNQITRSAEWMEGQKRSNST